MRIATFNLENLDSSARADPPLEARLPVLRAALDRLGADILCLQEINAQAETNRPHGERRLEALATLLAGTGYEGFHVAATETRNRHTPMDVHNLAIVSRWPVAASRQYWNDLVPAPLIETVSAVPARDGPGEVRWDRPVLYAEIDAPRGPLHVFNLHLRAPIATAIPGVKEAPFVWKNVPGWAEGYYLSAVKRSGQACEARIAIDRVFDADSEAEIAVCGDLNAEIREMPLRILLADVEATGNGALADRSLVALDERIPPHLRHTVRHAGNRLMLDHILASHALARRCVSVEAHNQTLGDEVIGYSTAHASPESYHAPLVAAFD